jgi:TusA-related sulfurtransferase
MFTLDITKDHCPMTFVKVKLMLAKLKKGDVLDVRLSRGEPLENVPRSAEEEGHRIVEIRDTTDDCHVIIEKVAA